METVIKIFAPAALALSLIGCSHNPLDDTDSLTSLAVTAEAATKASDTVWNADDIGVTAVSVTPATSQSAMVSAYRNAKYSTASTGASASFSPADEGQTVYFDDFSATVAFTAYGPYQESEIDALPGDGGVISGSTETQVTAGNTDAVDPAQEAVDYIFAPAVTASADRPKANFEFSHCMAKITVTVLAGTDLDAADVRDMDGSSYTLAGLVHEGTFDVTTGIAAAAGSAQEDVQWDLAASCPCAEVDGGISFTAVVYPQTPLSLVFRATVAGEAFTEAEFPVPSIAGGDGADGFAAGQSYTYTVTLTDSAPGTNAVKACRVGRRDGVAD